MTDQQPLFVPPEPESLEDTGLPPTLVEQLIVKILYYRGEMYGRNLATAIGLRFSVIQPLVEALLVQHTIQIKSSLGVGMIGSMFALTDAGRGRAREYMDENQYGGAAPVPISQYCEVVKRQCPPAGWLTKKAVREALKGLVVTEELISQIGPAISSGNSLLIYGKPGDGKTYLLESLNSIDAAPVFVPHAIEYQGQIIRVFDPIYHSVVQREEPSTVTVFPSAPHDLRWVECRRPFIITGGELTLDMLDLRYNATSKVYEAPFQIKANNGIYLLDDFGRQRATPAEIFNRWIVPLERKVDYLSFLTGGKITVPFEMFLVLSTNLSPEDLGDEAFLRRIQYKMLLDGPSETEFRHIFERCCNSASLTCNSHIINHLLEKHYLSPGKTFRRCHPRDILSHAVNLIRFEGLPSDLTDEVLDRAVQSCFVQKEHRKGDVVPMPPASMRRDLFQRPIN